MTGNFCQSVSIIRDIYTLSRITTQPDILFVFYKMCHRQKFHILLLCLVESSVVSGEGISTICGGPSWFDWCLNNSFCSISNTKLVQSMCQCVEHLSYIAVDLLHFYKYSFKYRVISGLTRKWSFSKRLLKMHFIC